MPEVLQDRAAWSRYRLQFESLVGGLQRRATIAAEGSWDPEKRRVRFSETYSFDDGHTDTLNWVIHRLTIGRYSGSEPSLH